MIKVTNIKAVRLLGVLLILLSGDAFAVRVYATQDGLDTEISNRKSGDSTEKARATKAEGALKAADTAETAKATGAEGTLTTAIATETARAKAAESPVLIPGDRYQGGIVFWVDQTGQHGLIAAKADQSAGVQWSNGTDRVTRTSGDGIGAGAMNTTLIIAAQSNDNAATNFAATIAADYSVQDDGITACTGATNEICYGDWYLPSKVELNLLYAQKTSVGGFAKVLYYWSSSELDGTNAWSQSFDDGYQYNFYKYYPLFRVRAVRAF